EAGFRLSANAERHLKPASEMARLFRGYEAALARSLEIVERCRFSLDELRYEYPEEPVPQSRMAGMTPQQHLAQLAWQGAAERFSKNPSPALGEREGPAPQTWEGEGFSAAGTLTRLRPAASGTFSRGAGEGPLANGGEG